MILKKIFHRHNWVVAETENKLSHLNTGGKYIINEGFVAKTIFCPSCGENLKIEKNYENGIFSIYDRNS